MNSMTAERQSIYRLMSNEALAAAIVDLEHYVAQLEFSRGPVAPALRAAYTDALDCARAEAERRLA